MIVHKKSGIEEIAKIINQLFQLVFGFISHYNWLGEGLSLMLLLFYCIFIKESQKISQFQEVSGRTRPILECQGDSPPPNFFMCLLWLGYKWILFIIDYRPWCDIKCDKYINWIMLVGGQNKKYAKNVANPSKSM